MYRAKQAGKARCEVFDPAMHSSAVRRLKLETDLRRGLEQGELLVYYQPIISLESGKIIGFEALSRWKTANGMVSPAEFIPIADETGLILPINRALMTESFHQLLAWQSKIRCTPPLSMSLNITPRQFAQPELAKEIGGIIKDSGVRPSAVNLEITETIAMGDADHAFSVLSDLKSLGVRLSIDDFGTGYSALARLRSLPFDTLKVDKAFVDGLGDPAQGATLVETILDMARSLGLEVIAEGVESARQAEFLRQQDCALAQGYYFSRPVAAEVIADMLGVAGAAGAVR
jgi:EAL domain-containing protein (putative c-di-GMP-specific phosphodiesterase class I)